MVKFFNYEQVNSDSDDKTLYGDIIRHCKNYKEYIEPSSKYTSAHECTHGINNDLRNMSGDWQGKNGFYVGKDRAILLDEPKIRKSQIVEFIPSQLRSNRYQLYIVGQTDWDDKPLYIYDEGVAYINGAWAAIELKEQENYVESIDYNHKSVSLMQLSPLEIGHSLHQDSCDPSRVTTYPYPPYKLSDTDSTNNVKVGNTIVDGNVEFIPYMTAVLLAADKLSPPLHQNLIDFSRWLFVHSTNAYYRCLKNFPPFDVQDKLWSTIKSDSCYESQRKFLSDRIGFVFPDSEIPEDGPTPPIPNPWYI